MDIQFILMVIIFVAALAYVGWIVYRSIFPKSGSCGSGCAKCPASMVEIADEKK